MDTFSALTLISQYPQTLIGPQLLLFISFIFLIFSLHHFDSLESKQVFCCPYSSDRDIKNYCNCLQKILQRNLYEFITELVNFAIQPFLHTYFLPTERMQREFCLIELMLEREKNKSSYRFDLNHFFGLLAKLCENWLNIKFMNLMLQRFSARHLWDVCSLLIKKPFLRSHSLVVENGRKI